MRLRGPSLVLLAALCSVVTLGHAAVVDHRGGAVSPDPDPDRFLEVLVEL